jgi:uncharacterized surface anchored protein
MKHKIRNITFLLLAVFGCFLGITNVHAETVPLAMNKTGYYWNRYQAGGNHSWYLDNYNFNDRVAYCIEPGIKEGTNYNSGNVSNSGYSVETMNRVLLVAYYGYDYPNHQTQNFRMATQALIWETVGASNVTYSTQRWGAGTTIDVSQERNEINNLVNNHYAKPSFNGNNYQVKVGESITINDSNNVLSNYDVISIDKANYTINGNSITITPTDVGNISIKLKKKMYTSREYIVYYGSGQKMISAGAVDPVYATINVESKGGKVDITKYDKDNNSTKPSGEAILSGAIYGIYNAETDALISKITTNDNSEATLQNLPYFGKFYLKEITPSIGYQLDDTKYYFDSNLQNIDNKITVKEKVINRDIELTKVYATDESKIMTSEPNVKFGFYDKNGNLYKEETTDENGRMTVNLVYGSYTVKQLTTSKDTTKVKDFSLNVKEMGNKIIYTISNAKITAKLRVVKIDSETKEVIKRSGIKFKIYDEENKKYVCQTTSYPKATICEYETGKDGEFITPFVLDSGNYRLEEVDQSIDGYLWNKESHEFTIGENSELRTDSEYGVIFDVNFENTPVKGEVKIEKVGETIELEEGKGYKYNKESLKDIIFGLYDQDNNKVAEGKTDEKGNLTFSNLKLGNYCIKELKTLDGYVLNETPICFELKYKDQYTPVITYKTLVINKVKTGELDFTKTDLSESKTLPNTTIEIYTEDNKLVYTGKTDNQGKIVIERLPIGKYYILEKEAPKGYNLNSEKMPFEILENGQVVKAIMKDEKIIEVPNTEKNEFPILELGSVLLCSIGLGIIIYVKNRKNK